MKPRNSTLYLYIILGMLSAFGPFVTDFYLPALPELNSDFNTTPSMVQLSLTVCMVGLALGQLVVGPLSDRYGRKRPLLASLLFFLIATAGCIFAPTIGWFIASRLIQGVAGAGSLVLSKSIATDLYEGDELARFFSILVPIQGIAPVAAPVVGGLIMKVTDWHGIFILLFVLGLLLVAAGFQFRESLPSAQRLTGPRQPIFKSFAPLFRNQTFVLYLLIQTFAMGVMFSYIASSPFIFQNAYGISPLGYSLIFGLNAIGIMCGGLLAPHCGHPEVAVKRGIRGFCTMGIILAGFLIAELSIVWVETALFLTLVLMGIILPTSTSLAMDCERERAGKASALLGALQFLLGGLLSPIAGLGNIFIPTALLILGCALCMLGCLARLNHTSSTSSNAAAMHQNMQTEPKLAVVTKTTGRRQKPYGKAL